jgi:hypothetical protein
LEKIYRISRDFNELKQNLAKKKFSGKLLNLFKDSKFLINIGLRYCRRHPDFVHYAIQEALDGDFSLKSIRKKFKKLKKEKKKNKVA